MVVTDTRQSYYPKRSQNFNSHFPSGMLINTQTHFAFPINPDNHKLQIWDSAQYSLWPRSNTLDSALQWNGSKNFLEAWNYGSDFYGRTTYDIFSTLHNALKCDQPVPLGRISFPATDTHRPRLQSTGSIHARWIWVKTRNSNSVSSLAHAI